MAKTVTRSLRSALYSLGAALIFVHGSHAQTVDVFELSKLKSQAEEWTGQLKAKYGADSAEYKRARVLYSDARSSIDGWVDQVKADIIANRDVRLSKGTQKHQDDATTKAQRLVDYLNGLFAKGAFPAAVVIGAVAPPFIDAIAKISIELLKERDANNKARLEAMAKQLEALRWKPFDEI